jgi:hypothetical protein
MDRNLNQTDGKKSYDPPQLTVISLRPEEAVLGHCKVTGGTGPVTAGCQPFGACPNQGS